FQNDGSVGGACRNAKALGPLKSLFPTLADLRVPMSNEVGSNPDSKKQRKVPDIGQENLKQSRHILNNLATTNLVTHILFVAWLNIPIFVCAPLGRAYAP